MSWPSVADYQDAVQNPQLAFDDRDLQQCAIECDMFGLPKARAGNFAVVYKATGRDGRTWAVRCFHREVNGQHERYDAIAAALARLRLPFTVGFTYQPRGVSVHGSRFPLLKMQWVQGGEGLVSYIEQHLGSPERLSDLADELAHIVRTLNSHGIAHGDLQHGNILIVGGRPVLIDYDGMFVPALAGRAGTEDGHPNYQHPRRTQKHFAAGLDNFALWVIALSLKALAADHRLWKKHDGGDDCLLLRRGDFTQPDRSQALKDIAEAMRSLGKLHTKWFRESLDLDPLDIPFFGLPPRARSAAPTQSVTPAAAPNPSSTWLTDHVDKPMGSAGSSGAKLGTPPWLFDHIPAAAVNQPNSGGNGAGGPGQHGCPSLDVTDFDPPMPDELPPLPRLPKKASIYLQFDYQPTDEQSALVCSMLIACVLAALSLTGTIPWIAGIAMFAGVLGGLVLLFRNWYRRACHEAIAGLNDTKKGLIATSEETRALQEAYLRMAKSVLKTQKIVREKLESLLADSEEWFAKQRREVEADRDEAVNEVCDERRKDSGSEATERVTDNDEEFDTAEVARSEIRAAFDEELAQLESRKDRQVKDLRQQLDRVAGHSVVRLWKMRLGVLRRREERIGLLLDCIESEFLNRRVRLSVWKYLGNL